jgi:tyrosyl-tRNA synthetase
MGFFSRSLKPPVSTAKLSEVLRERGYVYQHSSPLEEITDGPKRTLYLGVDPTADSMHVGQLQGMLVLRRFVENGHKLIVVIGAGTGMIGDPGGKSAERNLLSAAVIEKNARAVRAQFTQLLGGVDFKMVNNMDWLRSLNLMEFLRDTGKHFTVNEMIKRDSVRPRLETPDQSISYTEFSYMLLQAYDFLELHKRYGCDLQVGGSDQWGNILSGVELIRRTTGDQAYAFSWPLLVDKTTGKKFGKSEGGAVWLDAAKTSPFQFYQFWVNVADENVEELLFKMTLLSKSEIETVMAEQQEKPSSRVAQKKLAYEVTKLVHGEREADKAKQSSEALFKGDASQADLPAVPAGKLRNIVKDVSTSELRRLVEQGAVSLLSSGQKIDSIETQVSNDTIRIGKNRFYKVK